MKRLSALALALLMLFSINLTAAAIELPIDIPEEIISLDQEGDTPEETEVTPDEGDHGDGNNGNHLDFGQRETQADDATEAPSEPATEKSTEKPAATSATEQPAAENGEESDDPNGTNKTVWVILIISGALLILLILVLIFVLLRKSTAAVAGGTAIRVEVLSGLCYNVDFEFSFRRGLTIGSGKDCDLVFEDPRMLPMHAVISREAGGVMTLSECGDTRNTYIGGMKIFAPNRLRSGDIITIGMTSFRVFFDT